jgi:hypothetical protein
MVGPFLAAYVRMSGSVKSWCFGRPLVCEQISECLDSLASIEYRLQFRSIIFTLTMCLPCSQNLWERLSKRIRWFRSRNQKLGADVPEADGSGLTDNRSVVFEKSFSLSIPRAETAMSASSKVFGNEEINRKKRRKKSEEPIFGEPQYLSNYYIDRDELFAKMKTLFEPGTYKMKVGILSPS